MVASRSFSPKAAPIPQSRPLPLDRCGLASIALWKEKGKEEIVPSRIVNSGFRFPFRTTPAKLVGGWRVIESDRDLWRKV